MSTGKGNVLLGLLAGLAAGTILGILFAPEKGSETRRKVVDKGNDFAENVKKKFDDFIDGMVDKQEPIKEDH